MAQNSCAGAKRMSWVSQFFSRTLSAKVWATGVQVSPPWAGPYAGETQAQEGGGGNCCMDDPNTMSWALLTACWLL